MDFNLQPTLTGQLLELRPLRPDDFDALFAAASDPLIWEQHPESDSYNRELKSLMLDHAFQFVDRVLFVVGENNVRSQKALEKIGARFLKKSDALEPDGSARLVFAIEKRDYIASVL